MWRNAVPRHHPPTEGPSEPKPKLPMGMPLVPQPRLGQLGGGSGPGRPLCTRPANDRLIYVGFLSPNTHCQDRDPHREYTMCDSSALTRHFLGLARIIRFLFIAASACIGASAAYVLYILIRRRVLAYRSSLRNVPGPGGANWFKGNFTAVQETDSTRLQEEWVRRYGHVIKFQSTLWVRFPPFFLGCLLNSTQCDYLGFCRHRSSWPWTLLPSPMFYKTATLSRNQRYYDSASVFSLVEVCMTAHLMGLLTYLDVSS